MRNKIIIGYCFLFLFVVIGFFSLMPWFFSLIPWRSYDDGNISFRYPRFCSLLGVSVQKFTDDDHQHMANKIYRSSQNEITFSFIGERHIILSDKNNKPWGILFNDLCYYLIDFEKIADTVAIQKKEPVIPVPFVKNLVFSDNQKVIFSEKIGVNGQNIVEEYHILLNSDYFLIFKRNNQEKVVNEWAGIFDVYLLDSKTGIAKKIFMHNGLIHDIAGGGIWEVSEFGKNILKLKLAFADMGARAEWEYYIDLKNKKLLLGLSNNLLVQSSDYPDLKLKFDTTNSFWADKNLPSRTEKIFINDKKAYKLREPIVYNFLEDCDFCNAYLAFKVKSFNFTKKELYLDIANTPLDEKIILNYEKGTLNLEEMPSNPPKSIINSVRSDTDK